MKFELKNISDEKIEELKAENTCALFNTQNNILSLTCCEATFAQIDCTGYSIKEIENIFGYCEKYSSKY